MLAGLLRFEWRYHTRRVAFAVAAIVFALLGALLVGTGYGPDAVDVNAPYIVMQSLGLLSLPAVFVLTIFCAGAALRDVEHGMTELVFSTPVGKPRYLLSRFAGALLAAAAVMAAATLALMFAPLVLSVESGRLGPVRPLAYLWAFVVLVVPNLVLAGALLFTVATLTRSALATYVGGVAIYALYMVCALLVDSPLMAGTSPPTPESLARAALLDPFGLSAFFEQTRYWTPAERDVRLVALTGRMLLNRLLWIGVAAAALVLTYHRFSFRAAGGAPRRARRQPADTAAPPVRGATPVPATAFLVPALRSAIRLELRHLLRGWSFMALLALWIFVAAMEAVAQLGGEYGSHELPTTALMLDAMQLPLVLLGTIAIVYYAAEVAWRERMVGIDPLVDATPASSAAFYLAKAAALCVLPMVMALVAVGVGIVVQLAHGALDNRPALHLALLWYAGVPLALFAVGALAVQALAPDRWTGMIGGLALAAMAQRGALLGLEHPMLRFGAAPSVGYSDLDGFGPAAASFAFFMLYWGAVAALLACVSWGIWRRGADPGARARLAALPRAWGRAGHRVAAGCAVLLAVVAALLFRETTVVHAWEGRGARERWRADYERAYRRLDSLAQPQVVATRLRVDLDPAERRARVAGTLVLENRSARAIDTLWIAMPGDEARAAVPGARLVTRDARFNVHVFRLDRTLAPGARAELQFTLALDRGGVRAGDFEYDVAGNGTVLFSGDAIPSLGYRAGNELRDPAARRARGLAGAPTGVVLRPTTDSARAAVHAAGPAPVWRTLDATICTAPDQTALAPGELVESGIRDGRRCFRYLTDGPTTARATFLSARYAVRRVRHAGVNVEVWHDGRHGANVPRIVAAAVRSLDVFGARYGAYPRATLRIAEVPAWSSFGAFAMPGLVLFPENRGFLAAPQGKDVDLVTRRVAHEVSHQWWGHTLDPADVAGSTMLVETLAKHSEALVIAAMHGESALPAMLAFDEDRYLAGRAAASDSEPALMDVTGEAWLYYGKGAIVMSGLRDLLGAAAVDRALAALLAAYAGPRGAATTLDLRDALRAEAGSNADRALVDAWLGDRAVYNLRVDSAVASSLGAGRFRLVARIAASRWEERSGREVALPVEGELLDVVVLDGRRGVGRALYTGKHRVTDGRIDLALDLPGRPEYVEIDPFVRRIDRDRSNNGRGVVGP